MYKARDQDMEKSDHRRRRSRSPSSESEEERRRRRRKREREAHDDETRVRTSRDPKSDRQFSYSKREESRDSGEKKREYRRSRSPRGEYSSRHTSNRDAKHKNRDSKVKSVDDDKQVSRRNAGPLPSQNASFAMNKGDAVPGEEKPEQEKQKPNLGSTGLLAAASNSVAQGDGTSVVLKYHEPPEARKPSAKDQWKLFVFKGAEIIDTIELGVRSCWLAGRELAVVDLIAEHPSISKQHAVIQFRYIEKRNEYGDKLGKVKPYLIDLESANGTMLNKEAIPPSRYLELRDKDMIQFGDSTREYVLMLPPR